jgi:hypothetical protein
MAQKLNRHELWGDEGQRLHPVKPGAEARGLPLDPTPRMQLAKLLAQDPNYPSGEIIQTLADMLARHWYP